MATTQNTFTGDGSNLGPFSFTFKWLEPTDIKVTVAGVLKTVGTHYNLQSLNYSTKTGGQVLFTAGNAPANGAAIVMYRQTDDTGLAAQFYSGSAIRSQDLNENFTQTLYISQESSNNASSATTTANTALSTANTALSNSTTAISTANSAVSTANSASSTASTASTNASNAVTTANAASAAASSAVTTANTASTNASAAVTTANTASSNATTALSTANTASTNASTALSTANTALSTANTALSTANTASTNASNAVTTANTANSNATAALNAVAASVQYQLVANVASIPSSPADGDAVEVANSTGIESFSPLANRPAGFVGDTGLSVRMQYTSSGSTWNWLNYFAIDSDTRYLKKSGGALTGDLTLNAQSDLRFADSDSSNWVAFQGPATVGSNVTWTLPSADGTSNQVLSTNGSGTLSWATAASGGASVTTSDTAPSTPADGDLWYDSVGGRLYVYYQDANTSQWVDAAPQGGGSSTPAKIEVGNTKAEVTDTGSNGTFAVTTEGSERCRVDSSGRLLVGTSSARSTGGHNGRLQLEGTNYEEATASITYNANDGDCGYLHFAKTRSGNTVVQSGDNLGAIKFLGTDGSGFVRAAQITASVDGTPGTNDMPGRIVLSTTADGASSPTERMRIDSSGRLLVGTTSSSGAEKLVVVAGSSTATGDVLIRGVAARTQGVLALQSHYGIAGNLISGDNLGDIKFTTSDSAEFARISGVADGTASSNDYPGRLVFSTTADGASSPTERMRIENRGVTFFYSTADNHVIRNASAAGTTQTFLEGYYSASGTVSGGTKSVSIYTNGNIQNTNNSYGALSDVKLKENIVDASSQWDDLKALQVRNYNFKEGQTHTQIGLVAQEAELVSPGLVTESPDRDEDGNDLGTVTKSVNYSVLYMKAVKALQEAMTRIETLEAANTDLATRITALEAN